MIYQENQNKKLKVSPSASLANIVTTSSWFSGMEMLLDEDEIMGASGRAATEIFTVAEELKEPCSKV